MYLMYLFNQDASNFLFGLEKENEVRQSEGSVRFLGFRPTKNLFSTRVLTLAFVVSVLAVVAQILLSPSLFLINLLNGNIQVRCLMLGWKLP